MYYSIYEILPRDNPGVAFVFVCSCVRAYIYFMTKSPWILETLFSTHSRSYLVLSIVVYIAVATFPRAAWSTSASVTVFLHFPEWLLTTTPWRCGGTCIQLVFFCVGGYSSGNRNSGVRCFVVENVNLALPQTLWRRCTVDYLDYCQQRKLVSLPLQWWIWPVLIVTFVQFRKKVLGLKLMLCLASYPQK